MYMYIYIHTHILQYEKHLEQLAGNSACPCLSESESKSYRAAKRRIVEDLGHSLFAKKLAHDQECDCKKAVIKGVMRVIQHKVNVAATKLSQKVMHRCVCVHICTYTCIYVHTHTVIHTQGERCCYQAQSEGNA